jgi:hypothetical protein
MITFLIGPTVQGFTDASEKAYRACVYLRSFIVSHSRVAPVKKVNLPRLELSGAVLSAELIDKILLVLNVEIDSIHLWPDSTIFLSWISTSSMRWNTFMANRVACIQ